MPVVNVHRFALTSTTSTYAQPFDDLVINGPTEFVLGTGPSWAAGIYVIATYNSITFTSPYTIADVTVDASGTGLSESSVTNDTVNKQLTVTLF